MSESRGPAAQLARTEQSLPAILAFGGRVRELRTSLFVTVSLALIAGCFSRQANQHYQARIAEIDAEYTQGVAEIATAYTTATKQIATMSQYLIDVIPDGHSRPTNLVRARPDLQERMAGCDKIKTEIKEITDRAGDATSLQSIMEQCEQAYNQAYAQDLAATYWAADASWVVATLKSGGSYDIEELLAYSHNLRIRAYMDAELEHAAQLRQSALAQLSLATQQERQEAEEVREEEVAQARQRFAAAMSAIGQAMANPNGTQPGASSAAYASGTYSVVGSSCVSDFSCGVGYTCVKPNYSSAGTCARSVSSVGAPVYNLPNMDSVFVKMPKSGDCNVDASCPGGFRCDRQSGACLR